MLVLDFDGVLVESVDIKTRAFTTLFSFAPDHLDEILEYHRKNAGVSRFEKFVYIHEHILKTPLSPERFTELSNRFSSLVIDAVVSAPYVPGAEDFLQEYAAKIPLFVVSATPGDELNRIIETRGMAEYFCGVYGSPAKKVDHIRALIKERSADPAGVLYIGDAINDWNAAQQAGIRFIGRIQPGTKNPFEGVAGIERVVKDMDGVRYYLRKLRS
jgi:beta-phosphoglucomutase